MRNQYNNDYTANYPSILEVLSHNQDNLVLMYGNSRSDTYNALAFNIKRSIRRVERVLNGPTIADTNTLDFGYFTPSGHSRNVTNPSSGDEVFRIDSGRGSTLVEYGFSVEPDGVYTGIQTGDGDTISGLTPSDDRDVGFDVTNLSDRVGVLSDLTLTETSGGVPTTALSPRPDQGIFKIDSDTNGTNPIRFAFENQSGGQVTVDVIGVGMAYEVEPVTDEQRARRMVRGEGLSRRVATYGGLDNTNPNLPTEWVPGKVTVEFNPMRDGNGGSQSPRGR